MKLNDAVYVLPLTFQRDGLTMVLNLSLFLDASGGATLVDAGLPGQRALIEEALAEAGLALADLRQIIITHQDIDHIGSLHDLAQASGARVLAHAVEAPFIDGSQPPRFLASDVLAQRPELRAVAALFRPTPVDETLQDGAQLDLAGGVQVVSTPGHTPGHMCLYHAPSQTLVAGDALTAIDGQLHGPNPGATPDMAGAVHSVQKLAALPVQAIVCYHGGVVADDAQGQLQRLAQTLGA